MASKPDNIDFLGEHLNFHYFDGGVSPKEGDYREPWFMRPCALLSQVEGGSNKTVFDGGGEILLRPGDAILLPAGIRNQNAACDCDSIIYRWSHIQFTILHSIDFLSFFDLPKVFTGEVANKFGNLNQQLFESKSSKENIIAVAAKRKILGFKILELILSEVPMTRNYEKKAPELLRIVPALEYIEKNSDKKFSVKDMAGICNVSEPRFYVIFKEALSCSPMDYVNTRRINGAQKLFWKEDLSVKEVAMKIGFQDVFYFSKVFKKLTGKAPNIYKKEVKSIQSTKQP